MLRKKLAACLMCLCLLTAGQPAFAGEAFAPQWQELMEELAQGRAVQVTLSAGLYEWVPFETDTVALINRILNHCAFQVDYQNREGQELFNVCLEVGGKPVLSFTQKETPQRTEWYSDLTQEVYTLEAENRGKRLSVMAGETEPGLFSWEELLLDGGAPEAFLDSLIQGLIPLAEPKKISKKISGIGTAKNSLKATLTGEAAQTLLSAACAASNCQQVIAFLNALTFTGDKNSFTLYQDASGNNLALGFSGNAAYGEGDARKVTFLWGFKEELASRTDTLSITAPSVKGSNRLTADCTWERIWQEDLNTQTLSGQVSTTVDKHKSTQSFDVLLQNTKGADNQRVSGRLQMTTKAGEDTRTVILKPALLTVKNYEGLSFKGNVEVLEENNGITTLSTTLSLVLDPQQPPDFEPQGLLELVPLDALGEEALAQIDAKLAQGITRRLLKAVMALPQEDIQLLAIGLSQENWEKVLKAFQATQP